jgi:hypothetical protein
MLSGYISYSLQNQDANSSLCNSLGCAGVGLTHSGTIGLRFHVHPLTLRPWGLAAQGAELKISDDAGELILNRQLQFEDYVTIAKRRKWLLILPAIIVGILGLTASFVLPPK